MSGFKCVCNEWLVPVRDGVTVCWFCRSEYDRNYVLLHSLDYVPQVSRPVIKSTHNPDRRAVRSVFERRNQPGLKFEL